jgi:hypothetical protein
MEQGKGTRVRFRNNDFGSPLPNVGEGLGVRGTTSLILSPFEETRMNFESRRRFLWELGGGIASLALCDLLKQDQLLASSAPTDSPLFPKKPHFGAESQSCHIPVHERRGQSSGHV